MKCRYSHCKHESKEIADGEGVRVGNAYYHEDCYKEKNDVDGVISLWCEKVDPIPIYSELRGVVNTLVYKRGYPAEKVLYFLRWALAHGYNIKHPPGLYYLMKNADAERSWGEKQRATFVNFEFEEPEKRNDASQGFEYKPDATGFKRIIGR